MNRIWLAGQRQFVAEVVPEGAVAPRGQLRHIKLAMSMYVLAGQRQALADVLNVAELGHMQADADVEPADFVIAPEGHARHVPAFMYEFLGQTHCCTLEEPEFTVMVPEGQARHVHVE